MQLKYLIILLAVLARTKAICDVDVIEDILGLFDSEDEDDDSPAQNQNHAPISSASEGIKPAPIIPEQPKPSENQNSTSSTNSSDSAKPASKRYKLLHRRRYIIRNAPSTNAKSKEIPLSRSVDLNREYRDISSKVEHVLLPENMVLIQQDSPLSEENRDLTRMYQVEESEGDSEVSDYEQSASNPQYEVPSNPYKIYRYQSGVGISRRSTEPQQSQISVNPYQIYGIQTPSEEYETKRKQLIAFLVPPQDDTQNQYLMYEETNRRKPILEAMSQNLNEKPRRKQYRLPNRRPYYNKPLLIPENVPAGEEPIAPPRPSLPYENLPIINEHTLYEVAKINPTDHSKTQNIQEEFRTFHSEKSQHPKKPSISLHGSISHINKRHDDMDGNLNMLDEKSKIHVYKFNEKYFPIVVNNPDIMIDDHGHRIIVPMTSEARPMVNDLHLSPTESTTNKKEETTIVPNTEQPLDQLPPISINIYNRFTEEGSELNRFPLYHELVPEKSHEGHLFQHHFQELPSPTISQSFIENKKEVLENREQTNRLPLLAVNVYDKFRPYSEVNNFPMNHDSIPEKSHEGHMFEHHFQQLPLINMGYKFTEGKTVTASVFGEDHGMQGCRDGNCHGNREPITKPAFPATTPEVTTVSSVPKLINVV